MIEQVCTPAFEDDIAINPLQPLRDATDLGANPPQGGWERVFEYCGNQERVSDALSGNDYIVLHIDTDQGDHPNFNVSLTTLEGDRCYTSIVKQVIDVLTAKLGNVYLDHAERFLFAISVHSMESWLLLCLFNLDKPKNSLHHLNQELRRRNNRVLTKEVRKYETVVARIKRKRLLSISCTSNSLSLFLAQLLTLGGSGV